MLKIFSAFEERCKNHFTLYSSQKDRSIIEVRSMLCKDTASQKGNTYYYQQKFLCCKQQIYGRLGRHVLVYKFSGCKRFLGHPHLSCWVVEKDDQESHFQLPAIEILSNDRLTSSIFTKSLYFFCNYILYRRQFINIHAIYIMMISLWLQTFSLAHVTGLYEQGYSDS